MDAAKKKKLVDAAGIALVVVLAGVGVWMAAGEGGEEEKKAPEVRREKREAKALASTVAPVVPTAGVEAPSVVSKPTWESSGSRTNEWGNPAHWGRKKLKPATIRPVDMSQQPVYVRIFDNSVDIAIGGLLAIEPGESLIGDDSMGEDFTQRFLASLAHPIEIFEEDDDEIRAMKQAVIDTKADLKARYDSGEDIEALLSSIRRELRELGAYRDELKSQIEKLSRAKDITPETLEDYVSAANAMLDERGAKPIVLPEFYYRQIEIRNARFRALGGNE